MKINLIFSVILGLVLQLLLISSCKKKDNSTPNIFYECENKRKSCCDDQYVQEFKSISGVLKKGDVNNDSDYIVCNENNPIPNLNYYYYFLVDAEQYFPNIYKESNKKYIRLYIDCKSISTDDKYINTDFQFSGTLYICYGLYDGRFAKNYWDFLIFQLNQVNNL